MNANGTQRLRGKHAGRAEAVNARIWNDVWFDKLAPASLGGSVDSDAFNPTHYSSGVLICNRLKCARA